MKSPHPKSTSLQNCNKKYYRRLQLSILLIVCFDIAWSQGNETNNWVAPETVSTLINPHQITVDNINAGKKLFEKVCWTCHGSGGKGNGPVSIDLKTKPADLTAPYVQQQPDGALYWKITNGRSEMAAYGDLLTSKQRWQLVCYIRQISNSNKNKSENEHSK